MTIVCVNLINESSVGVYLRMCIYLRFYVLTFLFYLIDCVLFVCKSIKYVSRFCVTFSICGRTLVCFSSSACLCVCVYLCVCLCDTCMSVYA